MTMTMAMAKWLGLAVMMAAPGAAHAATYELGAPFHIACQGILVSENGAFRLDLDDGHPNANADDEIVCVSAIVAEKNGPTALKYTLKDSEVSRIMSICSVGKLCRIEGDVRNFSHGVFFFVKIDSISAK